MGRKPDPPGLQEAKGNPGKRRARTKTVKATTSDIAAVIAGDAAVPPTFLGAAKLKAAIAIWRELAPELKRNNMLERLDRFTFAMYCVHMADWISATKEIAKDGTWRLVKTVSGDEMPRLNPAVKVREMAERHILEIGGRFGLDPSNRYKLLRDQAAAPLGGLFDGHEPLPQPGASSSDPAAPSPSPVGLLRSLAAPSGPSRPN